MSRIGSLLAALLLLAYPLLVWWGLSASALPLWLPAGLALLFVLRLLPTPAAWRPWLMLSRLLAGGGLLLCRSRDLLVHAVNFTHCTGNALQHATRLRHPANTLAP